MSHRRFGFTVGTAFLVLGGLQWTRGHRTAAAVLGAVGGALILAALMVPGSLGPIERVWTRLGTVLSRVTTPLVMAVLYFAVITPAGLLHRLTSRRSPTRRRADELSYWVPRNADTRSRRDMEHQF